MTNRDVNPFIRLAPASGNPFRDSATPSDPALALDDSPESEAVAKSKYRGPVEDLDNLDTTDPMAPQTPDVDESVDELLIKDLARKARVLKAQMASDKESLDEVKLALWKAVGAKPVKKLHGVTFRPASPKRSTDLKGLEADHPEIYDQYVTISDPDPTEPGALYV